METIGVRFVDAFATEPLGGQPVAIVTGGAVPSDEQREAIAAELGPAVTVFLADSTERDRRIEYRGTSDLPPPHATVAGIAALAEDGLEPGQVTLETAAGPTSVDLEPDGTVWVPQGTPTVETVEVGYRDVARALGVEQAALEGAKADLPLAVASVGRPTLIVPITYLSDLGSANPDPAALEQLCDAADCADVFAFTFDALGAESTLHGRRFVPEANGTEGAVTGPEVGAAAASLAHFDAFDDEFPDPIRVEAGHYQDRPAVVHARLDDQVYVGGRAVTSLDGSLVVPAADGDDILEA